MTKAQRGGVARRRVYWVIWAGLVSSLAMSPGALAKGATDATEVAEAKKLFTRGSSLYLAGQYGEALSVLQSSHQLVPSPNSELVIARCLRELGRLIEAQEMFASAEAEARRRAAEGAPKYTQTANSAAAEGAAVRSALGTIRIQIEGNDASTRLDVDGVPTDVPTHGELIVWHKPGEVTVSVRSASGLEQKQVVTVGAGTEVTVGFGRPEPPPPSVSSFPILPPHEVFATPSGNPGESAPVIPATGSSGLAWVKPVAIASGALTVAGAGMFAGFRVAAHSAYQDLFNGCGRTKSCGPADVPKANTGKAYLLIADVSLVTASIAAAATVTLVVVALSHPSKAAASPVAEWHLLVGLPTIGVTGQFQ